MSTLSFLGLTGLRLQSAPAGSYPSGTLFVVPPADAGSNKFWKLGSLQVLSQQGLLVADRAQLVLDGLELEVNTAGPSVVVAYDRASDTWRPESNAPGLTVRLGRRGFALGPMIIPAAPNALLIHFKPNDPRAVAHVETKYDLLRGRELTAPPISLAFKAGETFSFDLGKRQIDVRANSLECRLVAGSGTGTHSALHTNASSITLGFSEIAAAQRTGQAYALDLTLRSGVVPLNLPLAGARSPAMEASRCRLALSIVKPATNKDWGGQVEAAALHPADSEPTHLRLNYVRNAGNAPEVWSTRTAIPLGFRGSATGVAPTPLLLPVQGAHRATLDFRQVSQQVAPSRFVHSWFGASRFALEAETRATLRCLEDAGEREPAKEGLPFIVPSLRWRVTRPWFRLSKATFLHSRPGEAYRDGELTWRFESPDVCGALPLLSKAGWYDGAPAARHWASAQLNDEYASMELRSTEATHESGVTEGRSSRTSVEAVIPDTNLVSGQVQLSQSNRRYLMSGPALQVQKNVALAPESALPVVIDISIPAGRAFEYGVFWDDMTWNSDRKPVVIDSIDQWRDAIMGPIDPLAPLVLGNIGDVTDRPSDMPVAILKLGRTLNLARIMEDLESRIKDPRRQKALREAWQKRARPLMQEVDPALLGNDWVGLLLFDAPVDYSVFPALKALVPTDGKAAPRLVFVAVSPREPGASGADVAMSGAIHWENPEAQQPLQSDNRSEQQEASLVSKSLKVAFRDRRLTHFEARATLTFFSFFGIAGKDNASTSIDIIGSGRRVGSGDSGHREAYEIRFVAETSDQSQLRVFPPGPAPLPEDSPSFVKQVWLRRVEVIDAPGAKDASERTAEIQIDGAIEFGKPHLNLSGDMKRFFESLRNVSFTNLRIDLSALDGLKPRMLSLKYPSLSFNLDLPHMGLLGDALKFKFHRMAIDWGGLDLNLGHFPSISGLAGGGKFDFDLPKLAFFGKLDFGSLPEMFRRKLSGFSLEAIFAINFENGIPKGGPYIGIGGFGFSGLNLDLLSFIVLKIERLNLGARRWAKQGYPELKGAALAFEGLSLEVMGHKLLPQGTGGFFSLERDGGDGFWALLEGPSSKSPLFHVDWAFAAQNVDFDVTLAKTLLTPPPPDEVGNGDFSGLHKQLADAWRKDAADTPLQIYPARGTAGHGWTFAASIRALQDTFMGRVLIQDGGFAGLALYGEMLERLFGWNFAFVGLYRQDIRPGEDYFYFSVTLPPFTLGPVHFMGGELTAELYTSGDFALDLGFPWPASGGGRRWERTLGAIITPGQASAGYYLRKREQTQVEGGKLLTVAGGFALQWGLGAAFGGGIFTVWVRIGVYVILEGSITLDITKGDPRLHAFELHGAAGVLAEGYGKLDWWVIRVRVSVRASAEIRASLSWKHDQDRFRMPIEAELHVSARAEACIGGSCARICRGISVSLSLPIRYQLEFG